MVHLLQLLKGFSFQTWTLIVAMTATILANIIKRQMDHRGLIHSDFWWTIRTAVVASATTVWMILFLQLLGWNRGAIACGVPVLCLLNPLYMRVMNSIPGKRLPFVLCIALAIAAEVIARLWLGPLARYSPIVTSWSRTAALVYIAVLVGILAIARRYQDQGVERSSERGEPRHRGVLGFFYRRWLAFMGAIVIIATEGLFAGGFALEYIFYDTWKLVTRPIAGVMSLFRPRR